MSFFSRCAATLPLGALIACGHLAFTDMPEDDAGPTVDSGENDALEPSDSGPIENDGAVVLDAALDGDAGCSPPFCPGTYVSGETGEDTNSGTAKSPVKTISRGIEIATALGGQQTVFVAASHYTEKLALVEGVSVLGGYACSSSSCPWTRDIAQNDTAILAKDFEGVLAPNTVTRQTVLEGFRIMAKAGAPNVDPGSVALTLLGGTPTITRCHIVGADTTSAQAGTTRRSIAVAIFGPSNAEGALLDRNDIESAASSDESIGVLIGRKVGTAVGAPIAVLTRNTIKSGSAPSTSAIVARGSGAGTVVRDNDISAGTSTDANAASSWGITVNSTMTIDANRINIDPQNVGGCPQNATTFCGGIQSLSSVTVITNNVVRGVKAPRSCAVFLTEGEVAAGTVVLNGNTLDGAGNGADGTVSAAVAVRIVVGDNATIGRVRNNILLGGLNRTRYGVYEDTVPSKTTHPEALDNNDFWNPAGSNKNDFAYRLWNADGGVDLSFVEMAAKLTTPVPTGNISADPLLDATYHLQNGSPCIDKGTTTEAPPHDMDRELRPKGPKIDVGADEAK